MTYIFLHIPKSGGTSLKSYLKYSFPKDKQYKIYGDQGLPSLADFHSLRESERKKFQLIMGHTHFGLHTLLPNYSRPGYFTVLRDPVKRVISAYKHIKNKKKHPLHEEFNRKNVSLNDFLKNPLYGYETMNCQVNMISGYENKLFYYNQQDYKNDILENNLGIESDRLKKAEHNLKEHFLFVGIQKFFDESLIELSNILGKNARYIKKNQSKSNFQVNQETIDLIKKMNLLDTILYENQLNHLKKIMNENNSLNSQLKWLNFKNTIIQVFAKITGRA